MLLVTDFGFLNEFGHVWHLLTDIDDSGDFLDADFRFISQVDTPVTSPTANTAVQTRLVMTMNIHVLYCTSAPP